jgi:hypothetical protein
MKKSVLIVLSILLIGCSNPYQACEKASLDIANGIAAGMKSVDSLRVAGAISTQEETNILGYLKFANDGNGAFASCAKSVHMTGYKTGAYTACAQQFQQALNNPRELALIHVSNQNSQQSVQLIITSVSTGVTAIITALAGK